MQPRELALDCLVERSVSDRDRAKFARLAAQLLLDPLEDRARRFAPVSNGIHTYEPPNILSSADCLARSTTAASRSRQRAITVRRRKLSQSALPVSPKSNSLCPDDDAAKIGRASCR